MLTKAVGLCTRKSQSWVTCPQGALLDFLLSSCSPANAFL
jgi:hypothetical protein